MAKTIKGKFKKVELDFKNNATVLVFSTQDKQKAFEMFDLYKDTEVEIDVQKHRKKRSINANSYCWALISQISEKMQISKEAVYKQYIRDIGVCKTIEVSENAVDTLTHSWEMHGTGWVVDRLDYSENKGFVILNLYYGSSVYNTKQMSRLIDAVVQDCKELGIDTTTAEEIAKMKSLWRVEM